jgi:hypothetical protein
MWGYIIGGALALLAGDAVSKHYTGKHLHEHLFEWYCGLRDAVVEWLHANPRKRISQVGIAAVEWVDRAATAAKRGLDKFVTLVAFAQNTQGRVYEIRSERVSTEEALQMIPELAERPVLLEQIA